MLEQKILEINAKAAQNLLKISHISFFGNSTQSQRAMRSNNVTPFFYFTDIGRWKYVK